MTWPWENSAGDTQDTEGEGRVWSARGGTSDHWLWAQGGHWYVWDSEGQSQVAGCEGWETVEAGPADHCLEMPGGEERERNMTGAS